MACPECKGEGSILTSWLLNDSLRENGKVKCYHCQKVSALKLWQPAAEVATSEPEPQTEPTAEVATVAESTAWAEEDLRHWRGELKKMFGGLVNEFCTSKEAWSNFDQVLLKVRHHLTTKEPSHLAQIDELLTPKGAQFITRQETDNEIYRLRGAVADNILDLSIHKLNELLKHVKQLQEN
jgi:hypothetical protein